MSRIIDPTACPDDNQVIAFVDGTLSPQMARQVESHIDGCSSCRQLLSELAHSGIASDPARAARARPALTFFAPGAVVSHFRVQRLLGSGGMAQVYLARDVDLGRKVALKFIDPRSLGSPDAVQRFLFEARATATFSHPNIITIYEVGEHDGVPFLALEYLEGETLRHRMAIDRRLSPKETLRVGVGIARALAEAHERSIIHRDLKPENVIIGKDGRARVLDFGLATAFRLENGRSEGPTTRPPRDVEASIWSTAEFAGTPRYAPPEKWRQFERPDRTNAEVADASKSDIWGLGMILYELISGRHPYPTHCSEELYRNITSSTPVPSLRSVEAVPAEAVALIEQCLAKDPRVRPSAGDTLSALEALLEERIEKSASETNPFRGLLPFDEDHNALFFGRDTEINAFIERLRDQPILTLIGPSGVGKTSFVGAGVIPRLKEQEQWIVVAVRPGRRPLFNLTASLAVAKQGDRKKTSTSETEQRAAEIQRAPQLVGLALQQLADDSNARVLVFVDQLEELFTQQTDVAGAEAFLEALCTAPDDQSGLVRVVFGLRDDSLFRLADSAQAGEALGQVVLLRRTSRSALEEILFQPVKARGYQFEDSLLDEIVADVSSEDNALPLLQFAAHALWEDRDRQAKLLRRDAYLALGGVSGALAQHADAVLAGLPSTADVIQAKRLLLRLVTPERHRRILSQAQLLNGLQSGSAQILDRLVNARLISLRKGRDGDSDGELELVHESLGQTWKQLSRWIDENREELAFLADAGQSAELWHRRGRQDEEVWYGETLAEALRALERCNAAVPDVVVEFLEMGRKRALRKRRRKQAVLLAGIMLVFLTVIGSLSLAWVFADKERRERYRRAEAQREGALASYTKGDILHARAKLQGSLELQDAQLSRILWWQLRDNPLLATKELGSRGAGLSWSPDGKIVAAVQNKTIVLIDTRSFAFIRTLREHSNRISTVAFSPDGKILAAAEKRGALRLWRPDTGTSTVLRYSPRTMVWSLAFHPAGDILAESGADGTVRLWNLSTRSLQTTLRHPSFVFGVTFSPDGKTLASAGRSKQIRLWDIPSGKLKGVLSGFPGIIINLAYAPSGKLLASAGGDGRVRLWDLASKTQLRVLLGHTSNVFGVTFARDGRQLASAGGDKTVRVWDVASGKQKHLYVGHRGAVRRIASSPKGDMIATSSVDKTVRFWRSRQTVSGAVASPTGHSAAVEALAFRSDGVVIASAGFDKTIRLWDVASGKQRLVMVGHTASVLGLAFSHCGSVLASASRDGSVRLWSLPSGRQEKVLYGHDGSVSQVAFSPDGKLLASGGVTDIRLWDWRTGRQKRVLSRQVKYVKSMVFSSTGRLLASAHIDGTISIWDIVTGEAKKLQGHEGKVYGVVFTPDNRRIVSSGEDGTLRVWSLDTGAFTIKGKAKSLYQIAIHPDGQRIGVPSADGCVRLWSLSSNKPPVLLGCHSDEANQLRFSPDGKLAATSGDDATVRLWLTEEPGPLWRAPTLLSSPLSLCTHRGWIALGDSRANEPQRARHRYQRAIEGARFADQSSDGRLICVHQPDDHLELWDRMADRRRFAKVVPNLQQVLALKAGCLARTSHDLRLYHKDGMNKIVRLKATAAHTKDDEVLVATNDHVVVLYGDGRKKTQFAVGSGVTSLTPYNGGVAIGFEDGVVELVTTKPHRTRPIHFESVPSSDVLQMLEGPRSILILGFADGHLGFWSESGRRLWHTKLHGPIAHLLISGKKLVAATELGDYRTWNLDVLRMDYCELLRSIWRSNGVVWEDARPVARPAPRNHSCME